MSSNLSTGQTVKQGTRQLMVKASDKMKLASSAVSRGDTRGLDVAIIKSTTPQFHVVPKEKHVRTLKGLVQSGGKEHVRDVIKQLMQRLKAATDWLTALKTLMVMHRLMRECDASFLNAMVQYGNNASSTTSRSGGQILSMGNFLDTTNIEGRFDYSEWVRGYGKYIDEQLEVYRELNFYPELEHSGETSSMRNLSGEQLLKQLPVLQRLQQRLMDCKPSGAAAHDPVVQAALMAVLKESFKVYKAISEGIINLADRFFEMEYLEAQKGLEIYKESIVGNNRLQEYYKQIESIDELKRSVQFPKLESLPSDFLEQMEGYVKEAPRKVDNTSTETVPRRAHGPLRKGTRVASTRGPARVDSAPSRSGVSSPRDPGMIGDFSKDVRPAEPIKQAEPNLLDIDDLSLSEPSPGTQGTPPTATNGFSDHSAPQPAVSNSDPFSQIASPPLTSGPPPHNTGSGGQSYEGATFSPQQNSAGAGNFGLANPPQGNPFGTPDQALPSSPRPAYASNPYGEAPSIYGLPQQQMYGSQGLPQQSYGSQSASQQQSYSTQAPSQQQSHGTQAPSQQQSYGTQTPSQQQSYGTQAPSQQQSYGSQVLPQQQGFGQQFPPKGGPPMHSSFPGAGSQFQSNSSNQPFGNAAAASMSTNGPSATDYPQQQTYGLASPRGDDIQQNQINEFGGDLKGPSPATPSRPQATAIAAGLTRPTNVNLAKEAALHDPFASLAFNKPAAAVKSSPPLRNLSPASASGSQPSPLPATFQTSEPTAGNNNGGTGFSAGGDGFEVSAFAPPSTQPASVPQSAGRQTIGGGQNFAPKPPQNSSQPVQSAFSLI